MIMPATGALMNGQSRFRQAHVHIGVIPVSRLNHTVRFSAALKG